MRELKDKAKEFKLSRDELFTPKIWANMIKIEDKAAELAIEGVLEHAKEEDFSQMDASWRSSLTENAGLLQRMQSVCRDEELFDFDYANGSHIRLFDVLSTKNKVLFYKLVLIKTLCTEIFGDTNAVNNINKGVTEDLSQRMKLTIPFINTYIDKIIMVG